jgi:hypothetical protein
VLQIEIREEKEDPGLEEEVSRQSVDEKEVPELEDSPPPSVNVVLPSPIRSGLKIKSEVSSVGSLEESQGLSQEAPEEAEVNQYTAVEETDMYHDFGDDRVNETKSKIIIVKKEKEEPMEVETNELPVVQEAPPKEKMDVPDIKYNVEEMTIINEMTEDGGQEERTETTGENEVGEQAGVGESGDGVSRELCNCILTHFCSLRSLDKEI